MLLLPLTSHGYPLLAGGNVQCAILCQCSYHYTVHTFLERHDYLLAHLIDLGFIINEIAFARTNQHVHLHTIGMADGYGFTDIFPRGCKTIQRQVTTQFNAVGPTLYSAMYTGKVRTTNFYQHILYSFFLFSIKQVATALI